MTDKPFSLAVRALILDEQQRGLLLRRSTANKSFIGVWEWPGGKADPGETFDEALHREVREETGLEIRLTEVIGAYRLETPKLHIVALCMAAEPIGGTFCLSEEHDAFEWVPLTEIPQWELIFGLKEQTESHLAQLNSKGSKTS